MSAARKRTFFLISICCILFLMAGALYYRNDQENVKDAEAAEAARIAEESEAAEKEAAALLRLVTVKGRQPLHEFARPAPPPLVPRKTVLAYLEQNPDTVGYIRIDGTNIDYPVVQGTDNEYYLHHTFDHIRKTQGSIFVDCNVKLDPERMPRHTLIHGHHMRDRSMFHNVSLFKERTFFTEHPYIHYETLYLDTLWQIFSVYVVDSNEYVPMVFKDDGAYIAYLEKTASRSMFPVDVSLSADDIIMTLNTCSYEFGGAHTLLCAKLVEANYDIDWQGAVGSR